MSKKEIRRAARDAFPKAKGAQGGRRGANGKQKSSAGSGSATDKNVPKPPSVKRSVIIGALTAFAFFALIEWILHFNGSSTYGNLIFAGVAFILYSVLNYWMDWMKYRRYLKKNEDSRK